MPGPGYGFATWFFDYDNDGWVDLRDELHHVGRRIGSSLPRTCPQRVEAEALQEPGRWKLPRCHGGSRPRQSSCPWVRTSVTSTTTAFSISISALEIRRIRLTGSQCAPSQPRGEVVRGHHASSGTGELGRAIAFADLDNDGDEEIVAEIGGATPETAIHFACSRIPVTETIGSA